MEKQINSTNSEEARLELERERLVLEQRRAEREGSLLNRHFSAIITAVVSVAAVAVSLAQIQVAEIHKSRELQIQQLESVRQWKIEAARFVAENKAAIFSKDDNERQMIRNVIAVAFPKAISEGLILEVENANSSKALNELLSPGGVRNRERWDLLRDWLKSKGSNLSVASFMNARGMDEKRKEAITYGGFNFEVQLL